MPGGLAASAEVRRPLWFAGLPLDRVRVMGVVNVTPDSFSDGGETADAPSAIARGMQMLADGADIIDVGGESTRPGAQPVPVADEMSRVLPVVRALAREGARVSIDSRRAEVIAAAIEAGAAIVNDVTALAGDGRSLPLVAAAGVSVILMHMQGDPRSMQVAPHYAEASREVRDWLGGRLAACTAAGIGPERLAVDPGIGFGKTVAHNLDILAALDAYGDLGSALVVGVSRKSFIARLSRDEAPGQRLAGSLAAGLWAVSRGGHILRVHDVAETRQAVAVWEALAACRAGRWREGIEAR
jgi:dihydropteroate synthase